MKKLLLFILCCSLATVVFGQQWGMQFSLLIENGNYPKGKTDMEVLLFGKKSAPVEFFVAPSFFGSYGFRMVKNSPDSSYVIEVEDILNCTEVVSENRETRLAQNRTAAQNWSMWKKQNDSLKLSEVRTLRFPISDSLAKKIHEKFVSSIDSFDPGGPRTITEGGQTRMRMKLDGENVTFRCTVDNDIVKTLRVHDPRREIGKLSDICKQLIKDLQNGEMDEVKYLSLFE